MATPTERPGPKGRNVSPLLWRSRWVPARRLLSFYPQLPWGVTHSYLFSRKDKMSCLKSSPRVNRATGLSRGTLIPLTIPVRQVHKRRLNRLKAPPESKSAQTSLPGAISYGGFPYHPNPAPSTACRLHLVDNRGNAWRTPTRSRFPPARPSGSWIPPQDSYFVLQPPD